MIPLAIPAYPPPPAAEQLVPPRWTARPSAGDISRYYPPDARRRNVEGRALIACEVALDGALRACGVVSEEPSGQGFGSAALALAWAFRMTPQMRDGLPADGGRVRIPISFQLTDAAPARRRSDRTAEPPAVDDAAETLSAYAAAARQRAADLERRIRRDPEEALAAGAGLVLLIAGLALWRRQRRRRRLRDKQALFSRDIVSR